MKHQIKVINPSKEERERFEKEVVHKIVRFDKGKITGTYYRTLEEHSKLVNK